MRAEADRALDDGFTAIKYGWGGFGQRYEHDDRLLSAARDVLGPETDLMVDAGMVWQSDWKDAVKHINNLDARHDLYWVEEPVFADDLDAYAALADACETRIVGGEEEYTIYGFRDLMHRGDVDAVQPDVARSGGITHLQKIATLAEGEGIPFVPHGFSTDIIVAANLHLIAANRNAPLLEYSVADSPLRWDVVNEDLSVRDGHVAVPDGPGLGITLNRDTLDRYATDLWDES